MDIGQERFYIDALDALDECEMLVLFMGYNKDSGEMCCVGR